MKAEKDGEKNPKNDDPKKKEPIPEDKKDEEKNPKKEPKDSKKKESIPEEIPYSCIPRLEDKYKDLSYEK